MMRILFLFFLLLNAAYFFYQSENAEKAAAPGILVEPPLPAGVDRLTLLRERGLGVKKALPKQNVPAVSTRQVAVAPPPKPTPVAEPPAALPTKSQEPACFTLGPFSLASTASLTAEAISSLGVTVERRQETRRTPKGYWVYLPASASYQAAKRKVAEMQKKGLKDLFIMGKGSHQNAISLGLFKSKETAEDRFQQVKALGLKAVFETQYRIEKQAWLDVTVPGDQTTTVAAISEMADGVNGVEMTQRKCR